MNGSVTTRLDFAAAIHHAVDGPARPFGAPPAADIGISIDNPTQIEGFDIVCLGCVSWLVIRSVAEYTMLKLSRTNRILFVEPFVSLPTQFREARQQNRERPQRSGIRQVAPNIWVYTPPAIALPGVSRSVWAARINGWILARLLHRAMRSLGFKDVLLWTYLYNTVGVIRSLPCRLAIYECGDRDQALAGSRRRRRVIDRLETAQCKAADMVFAVTDELADLLRPSNPATHAVYCAAEPEFFGAAGRDSTAVPADIARLPRPILGYMGSADPWKMDVQLLHHIARTHPEWSIALCGYVWFGFSAESLAGYPNIHVLGPKRYEDFPGYLKAMDVCIMPFPLNEITRNGDALKCYEYLAAGKPVVSTDVPAARRLSKVVRIAHSPEEFVSRVEDALADPPSVVEERLRAVASHTWERRTMEKSRLILNRLESERQGT